MRPPSGNDDFPTESPAPRQGEKKKRKRAPSSPNFEKKNPRRKLVRKSKESTSARAPSPNSLYRLRDESKGEGEAIDLVANVPSHLEGQWASEPEEGVTDLHQAREAEEEAETEASRDMGNAPKKELGVIEITDSPSFTESMYNEAQTVKERPIEGTHGADNPFRGFFDSVDLTATEDITGLGDLVITMKSPSSEESEPSSSPKLVNRFPAPSVDPERKCSITVSLSEDARVLSAPVGVASYLRCLVNEDDQAKMNEVDAPCLFNEAQQALNRVT
uniref:Uncharacterized protein n=1 Tax=Nicotiana tabacum TaxID=4097 RepID=A0A1S3ZMQ5_TOBAC|nr:PREDICTED: uncharacterized protein LOC107788473 [Nicotiana tabacum]